MIRVRAVEAAGSFRLRATFSDGSAGEMDLAALVSEPGPMTEALRDVAVFARVTLQRGVPTWPNGFDVSPGWLQREMQRVGVLHPPLAA